MLHAHALSFEINCSVGNEILLLSPEASRQYSMVNRYESHESGQSCSQLTVIYSNTADRHHNENGDVSADLHPKLHV